MFFRPGRFKFDDSLSRDPTLLHMAITRGQAAHLCTQSNASQAVGNAEVSLSADRSAHVPSLPSILLQERRADNQVEQCAHTGPLDGVEPSAGRSLLGAIKDDYAYNPLIC